MADAAEATSVRKRHPLAPLLWYSAVAGFNAALFFSLCLLFVSLRLPTAISASVALVPVLALSYLGHKAKTFASAGAHKREAPRFLVLSALDLLLTATVPQAGASAGLSPSIVFAALTALIPLTNLLVMRVWVFRSGRR